MELGRHKTIEEYFLSIDEDKKHIFPFDDKYVTRYKYLSNQFNKWIHPYVEKGAISIDGGYLNDHGPDHIRKVILRASDLIGNCSLTLTEYELYILLISIHIHDVGNIIGRNEHEINSYDIIKKYGVDAGQDRIEWECVFDIAEAHGGSPKDKITELSDADVLDFQVRKPLLAALLKLSDELAEDRSRASRLQLLAKQLPEKAEIYHKYSYCLHSVKIDLEARQIRLSFDVEEKDLCKKYKKEVTRDGKLVEEEVYLLNEIYERTYKTHLERMYCTRFTRPDIQIDKIRVDIEITSDKLDMRNKPLKYHIIYDIGEVGYPRPSQEKLFSICPKLKDFTGELVCELSTQNKLKDVTATY